MCDRCDELNREVAIAYPSALRRILQRTRVLIADGTLVVAQPEGSATGGQAFDDLNVEGPWPDYMEYGFACSQCGQRFRLEAETYHGAGGYWRPASPEQK